MCRHSRFCFKTARAYKRLITHLLVTLSAVANRPACRIYLHTSIDDESLAKRVLLPRSTKAASISIIIMKRKKMIAVEKVFQEVQPVLIGRYFWRPDSRESRSNFSAVHLALFETLIAKVGINKYL